MKTLKPAAITAILILSSFTASEAQVRQTVGAAEVNGTSRSYFSGRYKSFSNQVKILSVGKGKLRIFFELLYPYNIGTGEITVNTGEADGTALIEGDTAVYASDEFGTCRITMKFVKPGTIKITQSNTDSDCGFGHNVSASGTYRKTSRAKPKFQTAF